MPQSQTIDKPTAPRGRVNEPTNSHSTAITQLKQSNQLSLSLSQRSEMIARPLHQQYMSQSRDNASKEMSLSGTHLKKKYLKTLDRSFFGGFSRRSNISLDLHFM